MLQVFDTPAECFKKMPLAMLRTIVAEYNGAQVLKWLMLTMSVDFEIWNGTCQTIDIYGW